MPLAAMNYNIIVKIKFVKLILYTKYKYDKIKNVKI